MLTRRQFTKTGLALPLVLPAFALRSAITAAQAVRPNRSFISGVQFGLQPFCYHDLAMTRENRGELIRRLIRNGMGMVELRRSPEGHEAHGGRAAAPRAAGKLFGR